ncbi:MAG TPA: ComEC/Rec2 family competence protein [Pyrinomonadaceae bacterium]|nr:ComEC/Rec2 family competence protein [Pyrinomonadaceae bacterium]
MSTVPHRLTFIPVPLALLAASLAAGVLLARLFTPALSVCVACAAAATLIGCFALAKQKLDVATVSVVCAYVIAGAVLATTERAGIDGGKMRRLYEDGQIASGDPVEITGTLKRAPERTPEGFYLTLRVDSLRFKSQEHDVRGVVELHATVYDRITGAEYEALKLRRGSRVRVMTALRSEGGYRNPGVTSFIEYLDNRGLDAAATIKSPLLIEKLGDEPVFAPLVWLDEWRGWLLSRVNEVFSPETAGVLNASMLGNRHGLARATAERFREGGTFHVLVISGLHITVIGGVMWAIVRRVTKRRAWQWAASGALTWGFAVAVGAEASVVRAALMFTVVAFAPVVHRRASTINALGAAALALLVWRPRELFSPSFQLTFLSVLVIVAMAWPLLTKLKEVGEWRPTQATPYPPLCPRWWKTLGEALFWSERTWQKEMARSSYQCRLYKTPLAARLENLFLQRPLRYVFAAVLVSACVQVGLLPLLVVYFHRLSIAAVLLNVIVGVLMALLSISNGSDRIKRR